MIAQYWPTGAAPYPYPIIKKDEHFDVLIVGGGYSGLSAAKWLLKSNPKARIGVIEKYNIGYGASGRNAGFMTGLIGHDLPSLLKKHKQAPALAALAARAVEYTTNLIKDEKIDCDFENTGLATVAMSGAHNGRIQKMADAAAELGIEGSLWDKGTSKKKLGTDKAGLAFYEKAGGILNPYKLVTGLAARRREEGIEIFEFSEVQKIRFGTKHKVQINDYNCTADKIVIASNAYTDFLFPFRYFYAPLHVYHAVTEPLTKDERKQFGSRIGYYTADNILYSVRFTKDHRLSIATGNVRYFFGNRLHVAPGSEYKKLHKGLIRYYPFLKNKKFTHHWEGVIAMGLDDLPYIGSYGRRGNVYYGMVYHGHGLALANYMGELLYKLDSDKRDEDTQLPLINRKPFPPVPGEPLRKMITTSYISIMRMGDIINRYR